jgi:hypothetical protein
MWPSFFDQIDKQPSIIVVTKKSQRQVIKVLSSHQARLGLQLEIVPAQVHKNIQLQLDQENDLGLEQLRARLRLRSNKRGKTRAKGAWRRLQRNKLEKRVFNTAVSPGTC